MVSLFIYSFLAGLVTILSPCILPVLPIILGLSSDQKNKRQKQIGIVIGFVVSFTFFTLFLSSLVKIFNLPSNFLRNSAIIILGISGLSLVVPKFKIFIENLFSFLANKTPQSKNSKTDFLSGFILGLSLALIWTPCVGPILSAVISLAVVGNVSFSAFTITLAYSLGTSLPLFALIVGGQKFFQKISHLTKFGDKIQTVFGYLTVLIALAMLFSFDQKFQQTVLTRFPNYANSITNLESKADLTSLTNSQESKTTSGLSNFGEAPEIYPGGQWFNTEPLTISSLRGKIVLVDFWTYTCINCLRTLPYVGNWYQKYSSQGLVVIGVHSPEFEFEKDPNNLSKAIKDLKINYPVVQDNNFATWRAYNNHYWPAKYLIDAQGNIRYTHFGENDYNETEEAIQKLLAESGQSPNQTINNSSDRNYSRTPETYLGYGRGDVSYLTPKDKYQKMTPPARLSPNEVSYAGDWLFSKEYAQSAENSEVLLNFSAKNVYLVMSPESEVATAEIYLDDVYQSTLTIDENKLYQILNLSEPGKHLLKIKFKKQVVKLFAFTFG